MEADLRFKLGQYIYNEFRPRFNSNLHFADTCGIDEKYVRSLQKGEANISILILKKICDANNVKVSQVLAAIGE